MRALAVCIACVVVFVLVAPLVWLSDRLWLVMAVLLAFGAGFVVSDALAAPMILTNPLWLVP